MNNNLIAQVRCAQVRAGEDAVTANLARSGLVPANSDHDAYEGPRQDLIDWKRRALEIEAENDRLRAALVLAEAALADIGDGEGPVHNRLSGTVNSWNLNQAEQRAREALPSVRVALS